MVVIPSRVAVGYATGTYDERRGAFDVREADAHAWPELYIEGQGWTRWEPTPIRPVPPRRMQTEPSVQPAAEAEPVAPAARSTNWWPVLVGLTLVALLLAVLRLPWLGPVATPARVHADLYRRGRRAGILPRAGDSVEEYAGRLARAVPDARQAIESVARLLTARLYRKTPLTPDEVHTLVHTWRAARGLLPRKPATRR